MKKWLHVERNRVRPFVVDENYTSRMMLDEDFLEEADRHPIAQLNDGVFGPNKNPEAEVDCCTHNDDEIYVVLEGEAEICLDGEWIRPQVGDVIFIPKGVSHGVRNLSTENPFRLMTVWMNGRENDMYFVRKNAWGKVNCMIDEQ